MSVQGNRSALPLPVRRALGQLGGDLALARRRRRISTQSMAERLQISTATLRRLERGDPSLSVGTLAKALLVLNALERFSGARRLLSGNRELGELSFANYRHPITVAASTIDPRASATSARRAACAANSSQLLLRKPSAGRFMRLRLEEIERHRMHMALGKAPRAEGAELALSPVIEKRLILAALSVAHAIQIGTPHS
jgi:transcriptional regulator with XRE-family HTH domain